MPSSFSTRGSRAPTVSPTRAPKENPAIQSGSVGWRARRNAERVARVVLLADPFVVAAASKRRRRGS